MDATSYIGGVGGLAVALGIAAAMSTGAPSAWAEGPDGTAGVGNNGAAASGGAPGATSGPAGTGSPSAGGDRTRNVADARLDGLGDAIGQVRSEADKTSTHLVTRPAATPSAQLAGLLRPTRTEQALATVAALPPPPSTRGIGNAPVAEYAVATQLAVARLTAVLALLTAARHLSWRASAGGPA